MIQETETVVQTSVKPKPECLCAGTADLDCPAVRPSVLKEFVPVVYGHIFSLRKYTRGRGSQLEHLQVILLGDFLLTPLEVNNTPICDEEPGIELRN